MLKDSTITEVVFYLGLSEIIQPRLASSADYVYAVKALDAAWRWIEKRDLSGPALADFVYDEDGYGVGASMAIEKDPALLPVWGCVTLAVSFAAEAAYHGEGATSIREDISPIDSNESRDEFFTRYGVLVPLEGFPDRYHSELRALPPGPVSRVTARNLAYTVLHAVALDSVVVASSGEEGVV